MQAINALEHWTTPTASEWQTRASCHNRMLIESNNSTGPVDMSNCQQSCVGNSSVRATFAPNYFVLPNPLTLMGSKPAAARLVLQCTCLNFLFRFWLTYPNDHISCPPSSGHTSANDCRYVPHYYYGVGGGVYYQGRQPSVSSCLFFSSSSFKRRKHLWGSVANQSIFKSVLVRMSDAHP